MATKQTLFTITWISLLLAADGCASPLPDLGEETTDAEASESSAGVSSVATAGDGSTSGSTLEPVETNADAVCGNAVVEPGEACDGTTLVGGTCESEGFGGGMLVCREDCSYDTSGCLPGIPELAVEPSAIKQLVFSWAAVEGASYFQLEESFAPGEPFVQVSEDVEGEALSLTVPLHLRHQARYRLRACNEIGCTQSELVDVVGSLAEAVGYFKASNTGMDDLFGHSVALSADGTTLAVGARSEDSASAGVGGDEGDGAAPNAGAVYVFVRDDLGSWSQQAYVKASNPGMGDNFGISLSLSHDGNTLAVGAQYENGGASGVNGDQSLPESVTESGAVYVFTRDAAGQWDQQAYVKASNTGHWEHFGSSVALSGDGDTLVVGALHEDSAAVGIDGDQASWTGDHSGACYVFVRNGLGTWSQQAYIKASNSEEGDVFGFSVALDEDGDTLAVGASSEDGASSGIDGDQESNLLEDSGAVYVFMRDAGQWSQQAYIKASNSGLNDAFGAAVALSDDGDVLVVGAPDEDSGAVGVGGDQGGDQAQNAGAVYVFVREASEEWAQQTYIKASNTGSNDRFGRNLALSGDGRLLVVGAYGEDGGALGIGGDPNEESADDSGAAYVLEHDGMGTWVQKAYVKAPNTDPGDFFGYDLAINEDGCILAIAARNEESSATGIGGRQTGNSVGNAGAVYLY